MTNVPGAGFLVVAISVVTAALLVVAGAVALVVHAATDRPFWQAMGGSYAGVGVLVAALAFGRGATPLGGELLVVGAVAYLGSGVLFYAPLVGPGTMLVRGLFDVSWDEALRCATLGWVAGALAGVAFITVAGTPPSFGLFVALGLNVAGGLGGGLPAARLLHGGTTDHT